MDFEFTLSKYRDNLFWVPEFFVFFWNFLYISYRIPFRGSLINLNQEPASGRPDRPDLTWKTLNKVKFIMFLENFEPDPENFITVPEPDPNSHPWSKLVKPF